MLVPEPLIVVYPRSPVIAVMPILRVKVLERTPNVAAVPRLGVVAAYTFVRGRVRSCRKIMSRAHFKTS